MREEKEWKGIGRNGLKSKEDEDNKGRQLKRRKVKRRGGGGEREMSNGEGMRDGVKSVPHPTLARAGATMQQEPRAESVTGKHQRQQQEHQQSKAGQGRGGRHRRKQTEFNTQKQWQQQQ